MLWADIHECCGATSVTVTGPAHPSGLCCQLETRKPESTLQDVSAFRDARYVDVSKCWELQDVAPLANVHHVILSQCGNVLDVSALSHVHKLELKAQRTYMLAPSLARWLSFMTWLLS